MKSLRPPSGLLAAGAMLAALGGCVEVDSGGDPAPTETGDYQTVELDVVEQQGLAIAFVPVTISGEGPFRFALDTGASSTVIATDVVDQLGLSTTGEQRQVTGVIGAGRVEVVQVDEWSMGNVSLEAAEVTMIDLPSPEEGEGLQGLLGSDVLSNFGRVTVDYDRERLELAPRE